MKLKTLAAVLLLALAMATFSMQSLGQGGPNMKKYFSSCPYGPPAISCGPGAQYCYERDCIYP